MGKNNGLHITVDALCAFSSDKGGLPIDGLHERLQCLISAARLLPCAQQGRPKESLQTFGREAHERSDERKRKGGSLMMSGNKKRGGQPRHTPQGMVSVVKVTTFLSHLQAVWEILSDGKYRQADANKKGGKQ